MFAFPWISDKPRTSLFIIMSFVYAKLLVVVCIAYVISDVVTHHIPLPYYEAFFTYLYGASILFLLYVFCFLLQESTCCSESEKKEKVKQPSKQKIKEKEKEKKKEEERKKKEEKERLKKEKKDKEKEKEREKDKDKKNKKQEKRERFPRKMRDLVQQKAASPTHQSTYRRNSEGVVDAGLAAVPVPVAEISAQSDVPVVSQEQTTPAPAAPVPPSATPQPPAPPTPVVLSSTNNATDIEAGVVVKSKRKRKTTQNDQSHGSFFLRIGAIAFGLGTMIYNGLEFGSFFEIPFNSPCYFILRGVNPVLQMIFTFMQMYFIFMNSRLNIHRFKVVARFGLMHIVATNICVWIRTLVLEYLKEITVHYKEQFNSTMNFSGSVFAHTKRNSGTIEGTDVIKPDVDLLKKSTTLAAATISTTVKNAIRTTASTTTTTLSSLATTLPTTTSKYLFTTPTTTIIPTTIGRYLTNATTIPTTVTAATTTTKQLFQAFITNATTTTTFPTFQRGYRGIDSYEDDLVNVAEDLENSVNSSIESLSSFIAEALTSNNSIVDTCGRVSIMGTIVQDSAPYLFPFIIEYSLIGAAVIYVMWKHIGRNPRYVTQEDLEHRLEVMLSRRAVALAHAQQGRVDCVGASKGLFFGLLLLVGSLICLILFFVLINHPNFKLLAIYLADVSHCVLMVLSIIAIIIGFIRVQSLKFKTEEQSDLNDILLRVSAFGLFTYAVFSVIAGHLNAFTNEPNLLVMITGILSVVQVILQLLFIADVCRRRVHLPEHDRSKPGRQVVTFLLICNLTMWIIYTFEMQKVKANPVQLDFYGFLGWAMVQRLTLPLCIFHRFHSAVTLAEIWKTSYKARLE